MKLNLRGTTWWYDETNRELSEAFRQLKRQIFLDTYAQKTLSWTKHIKHYVLLSILASGLLAIWAPLWLKWVAGGIAVILAIAAVFANRLPQLIEGQTAHIRRGNYGWAWMASEGDYAWKGLNQKLEWYSKSLNVIHVITKNAPNVRELILAYLTDQTVMEARAELSALCEPASPHHPARRRLWKAAWHHGRRIYTAHTTD